MNDKQSFARIASILVGKHIQDLADELLLLFCDDKDFSLFLDVINLLFFKEIRNINHDFYSQKLTPKGWGWCLKSLFCAKCIKYVLGKTDRYRPSGDKLLVRDIIHAQKETSVLILSQCRTNAEIRVFTKILRGERPISRAIAIAALAKMCTMRYQYIRNCFGKDDIELYFSENLKIIFNIYPNYIDVAKQLREYKCDLTKVFKNTKARIGYPINRQTKKNNSKTLQVHVNCKKKTVKFFYSTKQRLLFDENCCYEYFKNFINVKNECILELEIEEIDITIKGDEKENKYVIIHPQDVLLYDGIQCLAIPWSSRREILIKIIDEDKRLTLTDKTIYFSLAKL